MLKYANINKQDNVIEIGSGKGHFTRACGDESMVNTMGLMKAYVMPRKAVEPFQNIKVIHEDILKFNFLNTDYKIFGNIPYNIALILSKKLLLIVKRNIATLL